MINLLVPVHTQVEDCVVDQGSPFSFRPVVYCQYTPRPPLHVSFLLDFIPFDLSHPVGFTEKKGKGKSTRKYIETTILEFSYSVHTRTKGRTNLLWWSVFTHIYLIFVIYNLYPIFIPKHRFYSKILINIK